jgi:hypothetical protein
MTLKQFVGRWKAVWESATNSRAIFLSIPEQLPGLEPLVKDDDSAAKARQDSQSSRP